MRCRECGGRLLVEESRPYKDTQIRRRVCQDCSRIIYTCEQLLPTSQGQYLLNAHWRKGDENEID